LAASFGSRLKITFNRKPGPCRPTGIPQNKWPASQLLLNGLKEVVTDGLTV
jgi:hypothetical protein